MIQTKHLKLTAVCAALFALQGCIAAAFPIAAGGLLARGEVGADDTQNDPQDSEAEGQPNQPTVIVEEPAATATEPQTADSGSASDTATIAVRDEVEPEALPQDTVATATQESGQDARQPTQSGAETVVESAGEPIDAVESVAETGNSGAGDAPAEVQTATAAPAAGTLFDSLYQYASSGAYRDEDNRISAVLSNPAALDGERAACAPGTPATVLIDLDPGSDALLPVDSGSASPALAEKLVQLRNQGMAIAWVSRTASSDVSLLRAALFRSGLDQLGNDRLLLIGSPDQRKQTLRDQLAEIACIIAIAGDERADFHELFDYLLNPQDAALLEGLFGNGWFEIPTPLVPERSGQ